MASRILLFIFRKDVFSMAVVYATLIINGKKTFSQVPERIKTEVRQVLVDLDLEYFVEPATR